MLPSDELTLYGVEIEGPWNNDEIQELVFAVRNTGDAFKLQFVGANGIDTFKRVMYTVTKNKLLFTRVTTSSTGQPYCVTNNLVNAPLISNVICYGSDLVFSQYTAVHELGHVYVGRTGGLQAGTTYFGLIQQMPPAGVLKDEAGNVVMGSRLDPITLENDWVRGNRGWGSPASTPPAVPCNYQQNAYTISDWLVTATPSATHQARERDEAAGDMFLNWVYKKIGMGGFVNQSWIDITSCDSLPNPTPIGTLVKPGDVRQGFMDTIVFPTLATYVMTPTP